MSVVVAATYNVHRCVGSDGKRSVERVARVIRELEADVVCLQEIECGIGKDGACQLARLAAHTGLFAVPGPVDEAKRYGYGNALLTRFPVSEQRNHNLAVLRFEARAALDVDLVVAGRRLRVIGTHLGLLGFERRQQVMQLLSILEEAAETSTLLLGDFNEWRRSEVNLRPLHDRLGNPPGRPRSFPARMPLASLDRVWFRPSASLLHVRAHVSDAARLASDHLPVVGAVQW